MPLSFVKWVTLLLAPVTTQGGCRANRREVWISALITQDYVLSSFEGTILAIISQPRSNSSSTSYILFKVPKLSKYAWLQDYGLLRYLQLDQQWNMGRKLLREKTMEILLIPTLISGLFCDSISYWPRIWLVYLVVWLVDCFVWLIISIGPMAGRWYVSGYLYWIVILSARACKFASCSALVRNSEAILVRARF